MVKDKESEKLMPLMDDIIQTGNHAFKLLERKDKKINVAGNLTDLVFIKKLIKDIPNVFDCELSAKAVNNELMIQAQITLNINDEAARSEIKRLMRLSLKPHEMPRSVVFG